MTKIESLITELIQELESREDWKYANGESLPNEKLFKESERQHLYAELIEALKKKVVPQPKKFSGVTITAYGIYNNETRYIVRDPRIETYPDGQDDRLYFSTLKEAKVMAAKFNKLGFDLDKIHSEAFYM